MDEEKCKHEKYTTTHKMVVVKLPELALKFVLFIFNKTVPFVF